jgi:hypothetical protein
MSIQPIYTMPGLTPSPAERYPSTADHGAAGRANGSRPAGNAAGAGHEHYDVRDLNRDGIVSEWEKHLYALKHPGAATSRDVPARYDSRGVVSTSVLETPGTISLCI